MHVSSYSYLLGRAKDDAGSVQHGVLKKKKKKKKILRAVSGARGWKKKPRG
jgi:hypothetical protein